MLDESIIDEEGCECKCYITYQTSLESRLVNHDICISPTIRSFFIRFSNWYRRLGKP